MGNFSLFTVIFKPFSARPVRLFRIFIIFLLIFSANNLFAQCPAITGLTITSLKSDGVSFKWNGTGTAGSSYLYAVQTTDVAPTTPTTVTDTFANVTGLTPATTYYIYVSYTCLNTGDPGWTKISFITPAACFISLPPSISSNATAFCPGTSLDITSSSNNLALNQWYADDIAIPSATGPGYTATTSGKYVLRVSDLTGCFVSSNELDITLSPAAAVPTITPAIATLICSNDSIRFSSSAASSYQWFNGGAAITDSINQTFTATSAGSYTVQVKNASGCSAVSAPVVVQASPVKPTVTPNGFVTICGNDSVQFKSSSAVNNQWLSEGLPITDSINQTLTAKLQAHYAVRVTNAAGCAATSDQVSLVVNPAPPKPTITTTGTIPFCDNDSLILSSATAANYQWYKSSILIPGATNQTFTALGSGITGSVNYTVHVTNGTCTAISDAIVLSTKPAPPKPTITPNGRTTFCSNDSVRFTSSTANGNQWIHDGTNVQDSVFQTLTVKAGGAYKVKVTNGNACSAVSDTTIVTTINTGTPPTISATRPLNFCTGDSVVLTSTAASGNQWYRGVTLIPGATQITYAAKTAGSYTVQITNGTCTVISNALVVATTASPAKPTITTDGPLTFCSNDSVGLTSSAASGNQWLLNGANITDSVFKTLTVKASGSYNVAVTANGCTTTSDTTKITVINTGTPPTISASRPLSFCSGDSVVLSSTAATGNQWFRGIVLIPGATQTTFTAKTAGSYTVQITNGTCTVNSNALVVATTPSPAKPTITADGPLTFCSNDSVGLKSSSPNNNQWLLNGVNIQDSIFRTLTVKATGSYNVAVTANGCTTTSDTTKITVINIGTPPTISANRPLSFCTGDSVVLTSTAGSGNQWFRNGNKINGETQTTFTAKTAGTYTVQLTSGTCTVNSNALVVTTNSSPAKPTITADGPLTFCSNDSVRLKSSAVNGNQWLLNGVNIQDSILRTLTVKATGSYNVAVTANGCTTTSDTTKITVINTGTPPTISTGGPLTFCTGDSVVFTSTAPTGNQWYRGGVLIPGATQTTFIAKTAGTYTVQLTSGTCTVNSNALVVTTNPSPAKPTIMADGPLTFCSNDSVGLTSSAANGNQWLLNGVNITDSVFRTLKVKATGSYNVAVNANGCTTTSDTTKVTVINTGTPPVVTADGPLTFCAGDSVVFTSSADNGNQWYRNGNKINGAILKTFTAKNSGTYTVQLVSGACVVNSAPSVVTAKGGPGKPTITPDGPTNFCSNDSVRLSSSANNGNQWMRNGVDITDSVSNKITVKTSGSYQVRLTNGNACSAVSDSIAIAVINIQQPPTISADGPLSFCSTDSVVFTSTAPGGNQWLRNGTVIAGATLQTYTAKTVGTYTVQLASGGCTVNSIALVVTAVNPAPPKPVITSDGPTTLCSNDSLTLTSSAANGNQWIKDGAIIPDSVSATLLVRIAGTYKVMVTGAGGCTAISDTIKVSVPNVQTRPTVTPDGPLNFCDGDSVTFVSTLTSGNQWFKNAVAIPGATRQSYTAKTAGSYTVQLSSGAGCVVSSAPLVVTVNPQPTKPIINADGPTTFCNNDSVGLSSSSLTGNQWIKDGVNIPDSISPTLMVRASGSYQVMVTGAGGCSAVSNALAVSEINNLTPPEITPAGALTLCSGGTVTLTSSSVSGNQWYFNGNMIVGAVLQTFPATLAGSYTVKVSSQAGCNATSLPKTIAAGITPAVPLIQLDDTLINCVYSKALYSSAVSGNQWLRNGVPIDGATGTYYIVQTTGSYSVQVTSVSGCTSVSATKTILVISNPNTPVITTTDPLSFCEGGSAVLHASAAPAYQWYKDGALINGATSPDFKASVTGAYTVQVVSGGCNFSSQAVNVSVINNQTPATITPAGPISVCGGQTTVLSSSSSTGNQWYKDGVAIDGAINSTYSVSEAGSYTVKITVGTCNSLFSTPVIVNATQSQTAPVVTAGGPLSFCTGGSVTLTASAATSYQWYKDGTAIPDETNATYTATQAGTYTVQIKNASACQATSDGVVVTLSSSSLPPTVSTAGSGPGCGAGQTVLISSSDLGNQWLKDGNAIPGAVQKTYSTDAGGNYSVALDYGSACFSESQTVTIIGNNISAILNASITNINGVLTSDSSKGNQWYLNDTLIAGATDNTYIPQVPGKYTLRITNANGCLSRYSDPYFIKLENFSNPNVFMFPNPVASYLNIVNLGSNKVTARVFDVQGRQLMIVQHLTGTAQINLSTLSSGTYVVQVVDEVTNAKTSSLISKY